MQTYNTKGLYLVSAMDGMLRGRLPVCPSDHVRLSCSTVYHRKHHFPDSLKISFWLALASQGAGRRLEDRRKKKPSISYQIKVFLPLPLGGAGRRASPSGKCVSIGSTPSGHLFPQWPMFLQQHSSTCSRLIVPVSGNTAARWVAASCCCLSLICLIFP